MRAEVSGMDTQHPLWGATQRVNRASVPIRSITQHQKRWAALHWDHIKIEVDAAGDARMNPDGTVRFKMTKELPVEVLGKTSIWVGEAVYNLRSALDYLVYSLASVNAGRAIRGTQFPIETNIGVFQGRYLGRNPHTGDRVAPWLHHVPEAAVMKIAELQPCWDPPCEWTKRLRDLSNPDKHRFLTGLTSRAMVVAGHHPLLAAISDADRVHPHLVVGIYFEGTDEDVIDTLKTIQRNVRTVVREFSKAFYRRDLL
jgi:hypothetical protein